jgi:DNA-binding transcriptional LysR family regulator
LTGGFGFIFCGRGQLPLISDPRPLVERLGQDFLRQLTERRCAAKQRTDPPVFFTLADYPEHQARIAGLFALLNRSPQIVEEHDGITSLFAAVESGRGVAVMAQPLNGLARPRLKTRPLRPAPPPLGVGIAYRKKSRSTATDNFIDAVRRAKA